MVLFEWFAKGGPVMWFLLACSGVAYALVCERALFWFFERRRIDLEELDDFFTAIHRQDIERAHETANHAETNLLQRLQAIWEDNGVRSLVEAFDLTINKIEERSHQYLYGLKTIVSVSPLLGILGTVLGIIESFDVLGTAGAAANPQAVGAGLAEALVTTAFGLMIAVPGLIAHNYFKARARKYVSKLDGYAEELAFHLRENGTKNSDEPSENENPAEADVEDVKEPVRAR